MYAGELIVAKQLGVVEQSADQRRLAVIDAAADNETQERFSAVPLEIGLDADLKG
jgi:hypothetical protein